VFQFLLHHAFLKVLFVQNPFLFEDAQEMSGRPAVSQLVPEAERGNVTRSAVCRIKHIKNRNEILLTNLFNIEYSHLKNTKSLLVDYTYKTVYCQIM